MPARPTYTFDIEGHTVVVRPENDKKNLYNPTGIIEIVAILSALILLGFSILFAVFFWRL